MTERVLVIAPHPDDEVLGVGGTMARHAAEGHRVTVAIVTKGDPSMFSAEAVAQARAEAQRAHAILGVAETRFLDFTAAELDVTKHRLVNEAFGALVRDVQPTIVYVPFAHDIHLDHQRVFLSAMVAVRPTSANAPRAVYAYETLSETNWNAPYLNAAFSPNVFVDIAAFLDKKLEALQIFATQMRPFPSERSVEAIRALAMLRGATVTRAAAEAFVLIREIR